MSISNLLIKHPKRSAAIFALIIFIVYAAYTPSFNVGYGDSDEFLTIGKTWGIAHPPGYSLYSTVLHIAMSLPIPGTNSAWRGHIVSGISMSLALYFGVLLLYTLSRQLNRGKKTVLPFISLIAIYGAAISIASAKLVWVYATIAEKYIFAAPFVMAIMYYSTKMMYVTKKTNNMWSLGSISLLYGLVISHYQPAILLLPYMLFVIYRVTNKQMLIKHGVGSLAGLLVGLLIPLSITILRINSHPTISWQVNSSIQEIIHFSTQRDILGDAIDRSAIANQVVPNGISLNQILVSVTEYIKVFIDSFQWWIVIPLLFAGLTLWKRKNKHLTTIIIAPTVLTGIVFASYLGWPNDIIYQATTERFYIISFILLMPLIYLGIQELTNRTVMVVKILSTNKKILIIAAGIIGCVPLIIALINSSAVSLRKFPYISMLYGTMIEQFKPNGIVTCYSDVSCFALLYEQTVNGKRSDITIVPTAYPLNESSSGLRKLQRFTYPVAPYLNLDIISWNIGKRPVYAVDISPSYYTFFGLDNAFMYYVPEGYYGELTRELPKELPSYDASLSLSIIKNNRNGNDKTQRKNLKSIAQTHFTNAHIYLLMGKRDLARLELDRAVNISYQLTDVEKNGATASRTQIEQALASDQYILGSQVASAGALLERIPSLKQQSKFSQGLRLAVGALTIDPENIPARLEAAWLYQKIGNPYAAIEYQHVLMLDPKNQEALDQLSKLMQ